MSSVVENEAVRCWFRRDPEGRVTVLVTDRREAHRAVGSATMFEVPGPSDEPPERRANVPMFHERACTHYLRVTVDVLDRVLVETVADHGPVEVLLGDELVLAGMRVAEDFDDGEPF